MRGKNLTKKLIIIFVIVIFIQINQKSINCEGLSLSRLIYTNKPYMCFHQPTNDILYNQINFLIQHQDQWNLKLGKFYLKNYDWFENDLFKTKKVFGYDIKTNEFFDNKNHYFISFGLDNINLYYQFTHNNLNNFYKLTDFDIFDYYYKRNEDKWRSQFMTNYFCYINNKLLFEFFNKKPELKYISDFRTVISSKIELDLKMYK